MWTGQNDDWLENDKKHDFFNKSVQEVGKCDKPNETNKIIKHISDLSVRY